MPIEYSVWVATGAFLILVTAVIIGLRIIVMRVKSLSDTATELKKEISQLSLECSVLIQTTDETMRSIQGSVQAAQGLVKATKQVSQTIEHTTSTVEQVTSKLSERAKSYVASVKADRQVDEAMQWAELAISAWQIWQNGRHKSGEVVRVASQESMSSQTKE